jgi:nicotinamide mononucleotide transporter
MPSVLERIGWQVAELSPAEMIGVLLAIAYLLLAIRQNIWCWLCAALSTAIYVYLFIVAKLYMEAVLNAFYFVMALYGWYLWRPGGVRSTDLPVSVWRPRIHVVAVMAIVLAAAGSGFLLQQFTDAALPFIDSLTTFAAIWATFLVARRILENWWYWLAIDAASVVIYWSRDLQLTSLLFVLYVVLVPVGWISWRRSIDGRITVAVPA